MIFASLGTMDMPFVRMAEAVDRYAATVEDKVIVQTGHTHFDYRYAEAVYQRFQRVPQILGPPDYPGTAEILAR